MDPIMLPTYDWFAMETLGAGPDMMSPAYPMKPAIPSISYEHQDLGANPMVQTFYEGPTKCNCCTNWIEKPPLQLPEAAKERYDDASVRLYKKNDHNSHSARIGGIIALKDDCLELQGQLLISFIRPLLAEVGFLAPQKDKITFKAPFRELYFAHPKIRHAGAGLSSMNDLHRHVNVLVDTIDEIFSDTVKQMTDLLNRATITFDLLWTLFPKDQMVYRNDHGNRHALQVAETEYRHSKIPLQKGPIDFRIKLRSFMFDGTNFGCTDSYAYIDKFEGVRRISSLNTYPLGFHSNRNLGNEYLVRGQKVIDVQDMTYCNYNGPATTIEPYGGGMKKQVAGRVIIDPFGARKFAETIEDDEDVDLFEDADEMDPLPFSDDDNELDNKLPRITPRERRPTEEEQMRNSEFLRANKRHLITMSPVVEAYSLTTNEWIKCDLDYIEPIKWNTKAFEDLVLDQDHKDILLTFCQKHDQDSRNERGLIVGKGNGLIVLLSGLTGTGKTLTVEAVADNLQRPLFRIQPDRLGSYPSTIGKRLQEAFSLALHWKAILLLDEADSLLSKRTLEGGVRNEVVSVMLRQLEYYRGILFMTTNLFDNIDHAVRSRIRLHIQYHALSATHRMTLWKTFLRQYHVASQTPSEDLETELSVVLSEENWKALASWELNGREIENIVKNVGMWCATKAYPVTLSRIEKLIPLTAPFANREVNDSFSMLQGQPRKRARTASD